MKKICAGILMFTSLSAGAAEQLPAVVSGALAGAVAGLTGTAGTAQAQQARAPASVDENNNLSADCAKSISRLYRFYFHEIYPNPKNEACRKLSETLGPEETAEMQAVIGDLRNSCPVSVVAQITGSFRELKEERDA